MTERDILTQYLPEAAIEKVYNSIIEHKIHLRISRNRKTKLGDYRPPIRHSNHRISINHDLNKYAFLITYIHELAHLKVFEQYKNNVAPHGKEWKHYYKTLMLEFLAIDAFPNDIRLVLEKSIQNVTEGIPGVKASSTSDLKLSRVLKKYDQNNGQTHVEDLAAGSVFETLKGSQFKKGDRVRTRYKCLNLENKKIYLFHPLTPVFHIKQ